LPEVGKDYLKIRQVCYETQLKSLTLIQGKQSPTAAHLEVLPLAEKWMSEEKGKSTPLGFCRMSFFSHQKQCKGRRMQEVSEQRWLCSCQMHSAAAHNVPAPCGYKTQMNHGLCLLVGHSNPAQLCQMLITQSAYCVGTWLFW